MQAAEEIRDQILKMITEEKEALLAYKALCARFHIEQNPVPEAIMEAKTQALRQILKSLPTSKPLIAK